MDVVIPRKTLLEELERCMRVADKKSAMPALGNTLITAEEGALGGIVRVAATDLYLSVSGIARAEVSRAGSVAVPAKDVFERVKAMPEGPLQILANENASVTLKAVGSPRRYTIQGIPGSEFPKLPSCEGTTGFLLPIEHLLLLIARTHFAISTDETRPHVNSGLVELFGGVIRMVSTDGHRLTKMEIPVATMASSTMLVPLKAVGLLRQIAADRPVPAAPKGEPKADAPPPEKPSVEIRQVGPNAFFRFGDVQFSVKLVDATFPPYQQVIPALSDRQVRCPRAALAEALRAVSLAASDKTGGVKVTITPGMLRITSESPDSGAGFDEIPVDYIGPEITIGFNAKYFLDVLVALDDEEITLGVGGELDPAVVRPATETAGQSYLAVVTPMRL
jgi:DNA polymerase-3 subunit beta